MTKWFEEPGFLTELKDSEIRQRWAEEEAEAQLTRVWKTLPEAIRSKDRLGPLVIQPIPGVEGLQCWMLPLDGSQVRGKILGAKHHVKLVSPTGEILYDGAWGDTSRELITKHEKFFIWLPPPHRERI